MTWKRRKYSAFERSETIEPWLKGLLPAVYYRWTVRARRYRQC